MTSFARWVTAARASTKRFASPCPIQPDADFVHSYSAHSSNYNVPVPTLSDVDSDQPLSGADLDSMKAFIATCQLTVILE